MDESCRNTGPLQKMFTTSAPYSDVCDRNLTAKRREPNIIRPLSGALSFGYRLMNWKTCSMSNTD